jgi:hypothetical protein
LVATYQPLAVPLDAVALEVEVLDGNVLRLEPRAEATVDEALVDGAEPALAEEVGGGEVLGGRLELVQREGVQPGGLQLPRQVLQRQRPQVRRAQPPQLRLPAAAGALARLLLLLLLRRLLAAAPEAPQQALPQPHAAGRSIHLVASCSAPSPAGARGSGDWLVVAVRNRGLGLWERERGSRWRSGEFGGHGGTARGVYKGSGFASAAAGWLRGG